MRLIFLGGVAEVGRNMLLLESGEDIIVIDCGVAFPEEEQLGIDLVLPDVSYLRERKERVRAIFVTHGHEDHIGALPYLLPDLLPVPLYATKLTLGLISVKLEKARVLARADLREFDPDEHPVLPAGVFRVEPFRVCHSIPDAVGFGTATPAGLIVHTSDSRITPSWRRFVSAAFGCLSPTASTSRPPVGRHPSGSSARRTTASSGTPKDGSLSPPSPP